MRLRVPEVIMLTGYDRLPTRPWRSAGATCSSETTTRASIAACSRASEELTIDHVIPRSQGGTSTWENCVLACVACNKRKADRTPHQAACGCASRRSGRRGSRSTLRSNVRIESWSKFISEAYWSVELGKR